MQPLELIDKYYAAHDKARNLLLAHSHLVARLALRVAERVGQSEPVDKGFIERLHPARLAGTRRNAPATSRMCEILSGVGVGDANVLAPSHYLN